MLDFSAKKTLRLHNHPYHGNFSLEIPISSLHGYQNVDGFKLDRLKLTTVQVLGSGNFGQVCKAIYRPLRTEVVVKSLKGTLITIFYRLKNVSISLIDRNSSVSFDPILLCMYSCPSR